MVKHHANELIGINKIIYDTLILNQSHLQYDYFNTLDEKTVIRKFLTSTGFMERKKYATQIRKYTLQKHRKEQHLKGALTQLKLIEEGVQHFDLYVRDHISHSIYVFLIGLMLNQMMPMRNRLVEPFSWKMASMLHDFGYPSELLYKAINDYINSVGFFNSYYNNSINSKILFDDNIFTLTKRPNRSNFTFDIIQQQIDEWDLHLNIESEYNRTLKYGRIDHGILGAVLLLKKLDEVYTIKNPEHLECYVVIEDDNNVDWGRTHFDNEIVQAITSIALHNIFPFNNSCIVEYANNPLLSLLLLSDTIQEWDRYSPGQRVFDPYCVNFHVNENELIFDFRLPSMKVSKIQSVFNHLRINGNPIKINMNLN